MPGLGSAASDFDAHTLLFASLAILLGHQSVVFAIFAKTFAIAEGLLPREPAHGRASIGSMTLERGLIASVRRWPAGLVLLLLAVNQWRLRDFGNLDYTSTMRLVVPGVTLTALGFQTLLASFLIGILRTPRAADAPARQVQDSECRPS